MNEQQKTEDCGADARYARVPADFPRPLSAAAVSGFQPKQLLTEYRGAFYNPGCSPPELFARWDVCEDLAQQLAQKSLASKAGKRADMSEVAILEQYLPRLIATRWTSEAEAKWVIRRTASILCWPTPVAAIS